MNVVARYSEPTAWQCARCNRSLEPATVNVSYMDDAYPVELLQCPQCGQVFVPEELALGKMLQVEQSLEDK